MVWQEVRAYEEARRKPYLTSVERIGFRQGVQQGVQQGIQQGIQQGLLSGIKVGLKLRFGAEGLRLLPEIYKIEDVGVLQAIQEGLETVESVEELRRIYA